MEAKRESQGCAGCGARSPETSSENSLISSTGWRLRRFTNERGEPALEWRCATCWAEFKRSMGGVVTPSAGGPTTQRFPKVVPHPPDSVPNLPIADRETEKSISLAATPKSDRATLTLMTGLAAGRVYQIEKPETVIGRSPEADIWLEESAVSRKHVRVWKRGQEFELEDLHSANGTFVSGTKVLEPCELDSGDHIQLGPNVIFRFALVDATEVALQRKLYESSTRDALTRTYNRKYLHERLAQEVAHARRHSAPLAVLMMDIDHFKSTNDAHGHIAGDAVLCGVADQLLRLVRVDDVVARYGGEEFVVIARSTAHASAVLLAERLRAGIEARKVQVEGTTLTVTASVGVASLSELPQDCGALELLSLADSRLYLAKEAGRNRVCGSGD